MFARYYRLLMPARITIAAGVAIALFIALLVALPAAAQQGQVSVSGDEADYDTDGKSATFRGNVKVTADGFELDAATLRVENDDGGRRYTATGDGVAPIVFVCTDCAQYAIRADIGERLVFNPDDNVMDLTGGVSVCVGDNCAAGELAANSATLNRVNKDLLLRGAPLVTGVWRETQSGGEPIRFQAAAVTYNPDAGDITLSGDAQITGAAEKIVGKTIQLNLKTGAIQAQASEEGRVRATFGID